ncbi:MAG: hypothetical protein J1E99_03880 [Muribaculaceae bacterium]|nr:hypothetical protein [Muribaculaceae bacterium]
MTLKVISPQDILFEGQVEMVNLPGQMGSFTVLRNHASLISALVEGKVGYRREGHGDNVAPEEISIPGGIAVVDNNIISVCVN